MSRIATLVTIWVFLGLQAAGANQCMGLFESMSHPNGFMKFIEKRPSVEQCRGTCSVEAMLEVLNHQIPRLGPGKGSISRLYTLAQLTRSSLRAVMDHGRPGFMHRKLPDSSSIEFSPGEVDIISRRSFRDIRGSLYSAGALVSPAKLTAVERRREDRQIKEFIETVNYKLFQVRQGVKEYLNVEQAEARKAIRGAVDELVRIDAEYANLVSQRLSLNNYRFSTLQSALKATQTLIGEMDANSSGNRKMKPTLQFLKGQIEELIDARDLELIPYYARELRIIEKYISNRIKQIKRDSQGTVQKLVIEDFEWASDGNKIDPVKAQRLLIQKFKKYKTLALTYVHHWDSVFPSRVDNWIYYYDFAGNGNKFQQARESEGDRHMTVITGIKLDEYGNIEFLELQQTWGPYSGKRGFHRMTFQYFLKNALSLRGFRIRKKQAGVF